MIKLDTFKTQKRDITNNWSELVLYALDNNGDTCRIAAIDIATGAIKEYPLATEERAVANIDKLKNYLIDSEIVNYTDWQEKASYKAKMTFASVFNNKDLVPNFYRDR